MLLIFQIVVALVIFRWVTTPSRPWPRRPRPLSGEARLLITIERADK